MPAPIDSCLRLMQDSVDQIVTRRYGQTEDSPEIEQRALQTGDCAYLHARLQLAEARWQADSLHLHWLVSNKPANPRDSLPRIKALCQHFPNLYDAVIAVLATHPRVGRDVLAQVLRQARPELAGFSVEDVTGMLTAAWVGGREGFDAVVRTRKTATKKVATGWLPTD